MDSFVFIKLYVNFKTTEILNVIESVLSRRKTAHKMATVHTQLKNTRSAKENFNIVQKIPQQV